MGRRAWESVHDSVIPKGIWRAPTSGIFTSSRAAGAGICLGSFQLARAGVFCGLIRWRRTGGLAQIFPILSTCHATPVQLDTPLA
jgi:hypothetical protein